MTVMRRLLVLLVLLAVPATAVAQTAAPACAKDILKPVVATHTTPPYPSNSLMMGEEGTTTMKVAILPDGSVSDAVVSQSSGSLRLDDAATAFVKDNWRWQPFDKACVSSLQTQIAIKWNLNTSQPAAGPYIAIDMNPADYPPDALARQEQGVVALALQLSSLGVIVNARVVNSSNFPDLDAKAMEIARSRWQFTPAQMVGKPVSTVIFLAMRWRLMPQTPQPAGATSAR